MRFLLLSFLWLSGCGSDLDEARGRFMHACFGGGKEDSVANDWGESSEPSEGSELEGGGRAVAEYLASGTIYDRNLQGALSKHSFVVNGSGYLVNGSFITDSGTTEPAYQSDLVYDYAPEDARFIEVSAFANASTTLEWFETVGYEPDGELLGIALNATVGGSANNAMYQPGRTARLPTIFIGNGDGEVLENLGTDRDVIAHEFAHHVIYRYVKDVTGESLIVHEALADILTMMRNEDPCLAASICPEGSTVCQLSNRCLRTADNTFTWDGPDTPIASHFRGQVLSGMAWDLVRDGPFTPKQFAELAMASLTHLSRQTSVQEWIEALLLADLEMHNGEHRGAILEAARARELF